MKKFINKLQSYSQKAEQFKDLLEAMPEKAGQIRDAVLVSAGQLKEMRRDVQATVAGLRTDNEQGMTAALNEVRANEHEIRKAGYVLAGVEMELDPVQRLILLLEKIEDVRDSDLQSLLSANAGRKTLHGVISSLIKAEAIADEIELGKLEYRQLRVSVGPIPAVRLVWGPPDSHLSSGIVPPPIPAVTATAGSTKPSPKPATSSSSSMFGEGSFFERRIEPKTAAPESTEPSPEEAEEHEADAPHHEPVLQAKPAAPGPAKEAAIPAVEAARPAAWSSSALDRFKKMPNLSKRR